MCIRPSVCDGAIKFDIGCVRHVRVSAMLLARNNEPYGTAIEARHGVLHIGSYTLQPNTYFTRMRYLYK